MIEQSPYFSCQKDIEVAANINKQDPLLAKAAKLKRFAGNFKFQAWEITDIPISDTFYYQEKVEDGKVKLVHESDQEESGIDILDATSDLIRNGWEKEAVRRWRQALIISPPGTRIIQINPKKDPLEDPRSCNYKKTQINIADVLPNGRKRVYQVQCALDTVQATTAFNLLVGKNELDCNANIKDVIQKIGLTEQNLTKQQVLNLVSQITGEKFDSIQEIESQKRYINLKSQVSAIKYLGSIDLGITGPRLEAIHSRLLASVLPKQFIEKQISNQPETGSIIFETSCGAITLPGQEFKNPLSSLFIENKWIYHTGDCIKCPKKEVEVGPCNICKSCEKKMN